MIATVRASVRAIEKGLEISAQFALLALMVVTAGNALLRYLFTAPISGVLDITGLYIMPALIWLALPKVQADNAQISATFLLNAMGRPWRRISQLITALVILATTILMLEGAWGQMLNNTGATLSGHFPLPLLPTWILIVIGLVGLALRVMINLIDLIIGHVPADSPVSSESVSDYA